MTQESDVMIESTKSDNHNQAGNDNVDSHLEQLIKDKQDEFGLFETSLFTMPRIFDDGNYIVGEPGSFGVDDSLMSATSPTASATSGHSGTGSFDPPSPANCTHEEDDNKRDNVIETFSHETMVPTLANDCLDYDQFVHSSIDRLATMAPTNDSTAGQGLRPLEIRVFGIPESGTKSRVETQIKLGLELIDARGERVKEWSHIKLPTHMVAREKLKRINGKNPQADANPVSGTALHESQVLRLDATVVCASELTREVIMCFNCVHREVSIFYRKRLQRKRDNKRAKLANKKSAKNTSITFEPLPDLDDEDVMATERSKILQFNCCDYVDYSAGETVLPTRFTCYCRHHAEKSGFRIKLALKDHNDEVVAVGISPSIMITDDHKSSKLNSTSSTGPKKRNREEYDSHDSNHTSSSSRKANKKKNQSTDGESDSGTSSPIASIPATPTSMQLSSIHGPLSPLALQASPEASSYATSVHFSKSDLQEMNIHLRDAADNNGHITNSTDFLEVERFLSQLPSPVDVSMPSMELSTSMAAHTDSQMHDNGFNLMNALERLTSPTMTHMPEELQQSSHRPRLPSPSDGNNTPSLPRELPQLDTLQAQAAAARMRTTERRQQALVNRVIPAEGPVYGGVEVTILGSGFYEGVTCLFGENPAMPTHCWSQNTLVCILPPATNPGTVVVSLKEHPIVLDGQDVPLFTYFDESDRALMELALQVVGLKTTGKLEDARQIAMRIVQGGAGSGQSHQQGSSDDRSQHDSQGNQHQMSYRKNEMQATQVYKEAKSRYLSDMESRVIEALKSTPTDKLCHIDTCNDSGHTMLHISALLGYSELCKALSDHGCDINKQDRNGYTALHFASWAGKLACVNELIDTGRVDQTIQTVHGKLAVELAFDHDYEEIVDVLGGSINVVDLDDSYAASSEDEYDSDDTSDFRRSDDEHDALDETTDFNLPVEQGSDESEDDVSQLPSLRSNILLRNKSRSNRRHSAMQMADWLQLSADPTLAFSGVAGDRDETHLSELTQASLFWVRELLTEIQQRASDAIADSKVRERLTDLQHQASSALNGHITVGRSRISHLQKYAHTMLHDSKLRARLHELQQQASSALNDTKLRERLAEVQQLASLVLAESNALSKDDQALAAAIQRRLDRMATHLTRVRQKLPQSARDFVRSTLQTLDDHLLMDGPFTDTDNDMEDDGWPWNNKDGVKPTSSDVTPAPLHQLTTQEQEHRHRFLNPSEEAEAKITTPPVAVTNNVRVHRFASRSKHRLELSSQLLNTPAKVSSKESEAESSDAATTADDSESPSGEEDADGEPVYYHGAVIMDENKYLWHREKYKRLKKDKLLYLFWLPILFVIVSLLLLHYVRTNSTVYEYLIGFTPSL
ncbi:hypothetical protein INT44_003775, partial [Umbelopsis vinacea]